MTKETGLSLSMFKRCYDYIFICIYLMLTSSTNSMSHKSGILSTLSLPGFSGIWHKLDIEENNLLNAWMTGRKVMPSITHCTTILLGSALNHEPKGRQGMNWIVWKTMLYSIICLCLRDELSNTSPRRRVRGVDWHGSQRYCFSHLDIAFLSGSLLEYFYRKMGLGLFPFSFSLSS